MGDCVINTSFPLLVRKTQELPAVVCVQRKAPKCVPTEDDIMKSNINSFGNAVGAVTNKITSMFEVQASFPKDSREYRILDYRIKCGQLYQQNSIDKTKGIESKPMPNEWYNWVSNKISNGTTSSDKKKYWMNRKLVADKKPYFMQYIYPAEKVKMSEYLKRNNEKCIMKFRISLDDLLKKENLTLDEKKFLYCYHKRMPLGMSPCTINKICWAIEDKFSNFKINDDCEFDYSIMKCNVNYSKQLFNKIKKIYESYKKELSNYMQLAKSERIKSEDRQLQKYLLKEDFKRRCLIQCPNEEYLCDIVLDLCYSKSKSSKQFAWDICGDMIISNLLKRNNYKIIYPTKNEDGDINFAGESFSLETTDIKIDITIEDMEDNEW